VQASVLGVSNKLGEQVIVYAVFLGGRERNKIWRKGSLEDEDDALMLNTRIVQRKCMIPHSTMKNKHKIIECCNNTHQGHHIQANKP